jgi:hypothetical protein
MQSYVEMNRKFPAPGDGGSRKNLRPCMSREQVTNG